ncbi:MAG: carbohydrate binding family 9 domain-containing protein, partial [Bacteroidia bacterium]|nr:carbohydrate binding family 9 domain-containing protein [Bacteroidia bacterium]
MLSILMLAFHASYAQGPFEEYSAILLDSLATENVKKTNKSYTTTALNGQNIEIDGDLSDEAWSIVNWGGNFVQLEPIDGGIASQSTKFKIVYDEKFLYIAYRCYDNEPEKIEKRLSRRDGFEGDWIEINIDGYNDNQTAASFSITAAGVLGDEAVTQDGNNWDSNWNPIWYTATRIDDEGWTAEIKIPFSQIRFDKKDEQIWGLQFTRRHFRFNERSTWQYISRNSGRWVSGFGELRGIKNIKPQKQLEIQPYIVTLAETFEKEEGNPFRTGSNSEVNVGLDGKIGIGNNFALDFTFNPDFGQVEADPSVVVLDGFQVFFEERRPFFIENRDLFDFRISSSVAGGGYDSDNIFYSRRIGGSPHSYPSTNGFVNQPNLTSIVGATKFSGQTNQGLSVGILQSVTAEETAKISLNDEISKEVVEPLTSYTVARLKQNINEGKSSIGGMLTAVNRNLSDSGIEIHKSAYTGAFDFEHTWKDRNYYLRGNLLFSNVSGSKEAIQNTQRSFEHLFQRIDADHLEVDPNKTSLTGTGGTIQFGKSGGETWFFDTGVTWRSPELELNDVGFMRASDEITHFTWGQYRDIEPKGMFNNYRINYNHWLGWNTSGQNTNQEINVNAQGQLKNFWYIGFGNHIELKQLSATSLRGGPMIRESSGWGKWGFINSDQRKKLTFNLFFFHFTPFQKSEVNNGSISLRMRYQPTNTFNISLGPRYNQYKRTIQYVTNIERSADPADTRYITASIDQKTFNMSLRMNYTISPNFTIQYWGQPFISKAQYSDFKYITNSLANNYEERYEVLDGTQISYESASSQYHVDEDMDGNVDYSIGNPDFNFIQFRSNLVARWEYVPGSELFLVWSQGLTNSGDPTESLIPSLT